MEKWTNFPFDRISKIKAQKRKRGNQSGAEKGIKYADIVTAFDIETTRLLPEEQSIMYIWQWCFQDIGTFYGRTWQEFITFVIRLKESMKEELKLVTYVHNLSYEFQFLAGIYDFKKDEVFCMDKRKILKCKMYDFLEFRCSYIHTNMSLDVFLSKMGVEHKKLTMDYTVQRYPWTKLSKEELAYCENDVRGLVEALVIEMQHDNDNLYTIPLTSTGYVRRDAKKAMHKVPHTYIESMFPNEKLYKMLREAFRGGNTHANRYFVNQILHDVHSADRSSSYPDVIVNCKFPVSQFILKENISTQGTIECITKRGKAAIFRCSFSNITLKNDLWGCPYLTQDKSRKIINGYYDNGRILSADYLETTLTDVDLKIVLSEYVFEDFYTWDVHIAQYGNLPQVFKDVVIDYYHKKTELKNVEGQELLYMKSKNKLNSLYGMMAQNPVKENVIFTNGEYGIEELNITETLEKQKKKAFLTYQFGVWVTAWARYRLEEGIRLAGDNFIYADTDSVKYFGDIDWDIYNKERIKDSTKTGAFATDPKGITHYMGVFESEADMCEFKTLGAKKYCFREKPENPLTITVAGVEKKKGGEELEKHGGLAAFNPGFIFQEAGGTESVYNDDPEIDTTIREGKEIEITRNVVIRDSTYTLGITDEYEALLQNTRTLYQILKGITQNENH